MYLYGSKWTRREFEARVGRVEQIGGLRRLQWAEGAEDGVVQYQVRTGGGLSYYVSGSRGLDISLAEFGGVPLSWQSPNGDVHPAYFDSKGVNWLRTAVGGLMMTCGLSNVGSPGIDDDKEFGLHGRAHHIPARHITASGRWIDDDYEMRVSGTVEETAIFGDYLRLKRTICSRLGENKIAIEDVVENAGFQKAAHMILYHFNFGFPLLGESTEITFPSRRVIARDEETPVAGFDRWDSPQADYQERVYYHLDMDPGQVEVNIFNPNFPLFADKTVPLSVTLGWSTLQLPRLVEWKMSGAGTHVLGIEPANCYVEGRAAERERGSLVVLEPGESRSYQLNLEIKEPAPGAWAK
jgi:hypothetical protein